MTTNEMLRVTIVSSLVALTAAVTAATSALTGCSGKQLDVGSSDAGAPDAAAPLDAAPDVDPTSIFGEWTGHVAYALPDGKSNVRVTLGTAPDGSITAAVFFGVGAPIAPATDPNVGYPPGYWDLVDPHSGRSVAEQFSYTGSQIQLDDGYLTFRVSSLEAWKSWCEIQPRVYSLPSDGGGPRFACCSGGASTPCDPNEVTPNDDPGKLAMCVPFYGATGCSCAKDGCTVDLSNPDLFFAMQLTNGYFSGTIQGFSGQVPFPLQLKRAK
jgi:hypothetical protein